MSQATFGCIICKLSPYAVCRHIKEGFFLKVHFEQEEQFRSKVPNNVLVSNVISQHLVFRLAEFNKRQQEAGDAEKTKTGSGGCCGHSGDV